ALANPTRRAVVARLCSGPASVGELAAPFEMAMPSFLQHIRVLEQDGLVVTEKQGRIRTVRIVPARLRQARDWLDEQRDLWERRLDQLDDYVRTLKKNER
ncbi:MAG: helix-turn-helix transcriptional regulator, partial [Planctomycetes bacterium]|nr:helix-turn-helix transcriptional regulator [Planctomycetota bacterium]